MQEITCPSCEEKYKQIALHWKGQQCKEPEFTQKQLDIMSGLLLGDADIKPGSDGSIFRLRMTNKKFLDWIDSKLSPLSRGVFLSESSDKQKDSAIRAGLEGVTEESKFNDLYGVRTVTHSQLDALRDWYSSGQKRYPSSINEEMLRMWYVTDGQNHLNGMRIRCKAQQDKKKDIIDMIETIDYIQDPSFTKDGTIVISAEQSREFIKNTESPPGFKYKWAKKSNKNERDTKDD